MAGDVLGQLVDAVAQRRQLEVPVGKYPGIGPGQFLRKTPVGAADVGDQGDLPGTGPLAPGLKHKILVHEQAVEPPLHDQGQAVCEQDIGVERLDIDGLFDRVDGIGHLEHVDAHGRPVAGPPADGDGGTPGFAVVMVEHHPAPKYA